MSFGSQANQPWQRNLMPFQNAASQQMYMQSSAFSHNQMQPTGQVYGSNAGSGNASVSFPQTYDSIGTVTKINNDCGLVNDEVFFYRNVCKGTVPKLGDRVVFEANLSTTGQFKWNATRIQSIAPQPLMATPIDHKPGGRYNNMPPPDYRHISPSARDRSFRPERMERRDREHDREHLRRSREKDDVDRDRKRRREDHDRSREVEREDRNRGNLEVRNREQDHNHEGKERERRDRIREQRDQREPREREKERSLSPIGRSVRGIRRYKVKLPKHALICHELTIPDIRQRYPSLYIPSLFFHADVLWPQTFTFEKPFSLHRPCQFQIMPDNVEPLTPFKKKDLEPNDSDYSYSAKVMLLKCPSLAEIYERCFKDDGEDHSMHLTRLIRFLVGTTGDGTPMAIGGYWSPSLDGPNPGKDPAVLIRTAIRTCKALTGIDLSNCTQWYRFCEYHYENEKNPSEPARMETVVIFLPDVHSCMPTVEEWQRLSIEYKTAAENIIKNGEQHGVVGSNFNAASNDDAGTIELQSTSTEEKSSLEVEETNKLSADQQQGDDNNVGEDNNKTTKQQAALDKSTDGDDIENEKDKNKNQPTHYSKLDLKSMKVQEMRDELTARDLPSKGVRTVIMARLAKAINTEKAEEQKAEKEAKQKAKLIIKKDKMTATDTKKNGNKQVDNTDVQIISDENESYNEKGEAMKPQEKENVEKIENETIEKSTTSASKTEEQDEQEEWEGGMDVDMNDIVILDEYDSRKNPEDSHPKELTEKDKERIMRRYTLSSTPHIIVHPNKSAKNGKFDCMIKSLSTLLEYSPTDTKQRVFEVALFAELFRDMLMRDFSFNIYKEIYVYNEKNKNDNHQENTESKENNVASKEEKNSHKKEGKSSKEPNTDGKSENGQSVKSSTKRKANASVSDEKDKEIANEQKNMITVKPHLLLSFLYFDTTHCGYIYKRDLEDMFYLCGLSLSRAQIHAFLENLTTTNAFYYRKLTDREATTDETPAIEDIDDIESETLKKIATGNFALFEDANGYDENEEGANAPTETEDGMINYKGTVVHVGKLIDQIKRTEKSFSDMEKLYNDLRKEHNDLQKTSSKANNKVKDLQSEVKSLSHKLSETNRDLNSMNRKYRDEHSVLTLIYNRVTPFVRREKDHKSESSHTDKGRSKSKVKGEDKKEKEKDITSKEKSKDEKKNEPKGSDNNNETKEKLGSQTKSEAQEDSKNIDNNGDNNGSMEASNNDNENSEEPNEEEPNNEEANDEEANDEDCVEDDENIMKDQSEINEGE